MDLPIVLDSQSGQPLHRQLYERLRQLILTGVLPPGQRVPSSRSLSDSLGVSRATVTLAFDYLLSEGYVEAVTGSGTFVCRQLPDELLKVSRGRESGRSRRGESAKSVHKQLSRYGAVLRESRWLSYQAHEPELQFSFGRPDLSAFPMRIWTHLYSECCRRQELHLLDSPGNLGGYLPLRRAIATHLARFRGLSAEPEQIIIVNGSQQALDLVSRVLIERNDFAGIEEPGYIGAKKALEVQGARLVGLPVDESGMNLDRLKQSLPPLKLVYLTPSHQFPTGVALSLPRRLELLAWAQTTGTILIEDDYDSEFRYEGRPVPALAGLDRQDRVIYIGTFSKVLFPALRLGYLVVPAALADVFARAKWLADRHSPLLEQQVLTEFIHRGHFERHIRKMRRIYESKRKLVVAALSRALGDEIEITGDNAGINVLVRFKNQVDEDSIVVHAGELGVGIVTTGQFYLGTPRRGEFLLNYGGLSEDELLAGINRFAQAARPGPKTRVSP